jgi:endoglucanase
VRAVLFFQGLLLFSFGCGKATIQPTTSDQASDVVVMADSNPETSNPDPKDAPSLGETEEFVEIPSKQFVQQMGVGWNLGNSFDVFSRNKTEWGNPLPNKGIIDAVAKVGFKTLRIPVTWNFHQKATPPYTIETDYLSKVQKVVDFALENNMHVIVNVHHDDNWILPLPDKAEKSRDRLKALWTQIGEKFKGYGEKLIFETLNEPRLKDAPHQWTGGTPEERQILNTFNKVCLDAIRATGGNNLKRHIMIPTYAASTFPEVMNDLVVPNNDPNVIISLHTYFPWAFAGLAEITWGTEDDKRALLAEFDKISEKWINQENRAVILGEWGTIKTNHIAERLEYTEFYVTEALKRGLLPLVWDDGGKFGLLDRRTLTWSDAGIVDNIMLATENSD